MKITKISLIAFAVIIIAACSSSKKSTASTAVATTTPAVTNTTTTAPLLISKSAYGIYVPGNEELAAIQIQYKEVTLDKLKEGHSIYTEGACIKCHSAQNIYRYGEVQWKGIIDDMAQKANISEEQKDAVYKYVLAIKAVQPKGGK